MLCCMKLREGCLKEQGGAFYKLNILSFKPETRLWTNTDLHDRTQ
jgi:hypothetical protein